MFAHRQTSLISILSSEHGRLRRDQRDIDKRDLQKALKYGTKSRTWGERWRVEYDGIVFITDSSLRREITAFPAPLAKAPEDSASRLAHSKAKKLIELKPDLCKSHTVLVVDNSGSMMTHDINLHRDRQTAAYTNVALEFVAEQLFNGTANNSDVISLVEFNSRAKIVFEREPSSWVSYNQLLTRRDPRNYKDREGCRMREILHAADSNYLPALELAERLLEKDLDSGCALSLLFLSDGAPTDARDRGLTSIAAQRQICSQVGNLGSKFGDRLCMHTIGFGDELNDFTVLREMVEATTKASKETRAKFIYCGKFSHEIGSAVSSLVTSLTETRTSLAQGRSTRYTMRNIASEEGGANDKDWRYYKIVGHKSDYNPKTKQFVRSRSLPPGAWTHENSLEFKRRVIDNRLPPFLAISSKYCGKGAERFAFRSRLADTESQRRFVLGAMVAKETNAVERVEENIEFHKTFLETQSLASHLANEFNNCLKALPFYEDKWTPRIEFLNCSVLLLEDFEFPGNLRGVLLEKMLDTDRFQWTKWNDNAGTVEDRIAHIPIDVDYEMARINGSLPDLGVIEEGDSDDEESDAEEDEVVEGLSSPYHHPNSEVKPSDYLQAFTHFTYLFTNKKVMVCDLQGVFNDHIVPPTFQLTDPAIHYRSTKREMVFGRTDKGQKGMQLFFTHTSVRRSANS